MCTPCIWVRKLRHNLDAVIHRQEEGLVVVTIGQFLHRDATNRSYGFSCDSGERLEVEGNVALGHLVEFITYETRPREAVELFFVMNACYV